MGGCRLRRASINPLGDDVPRVPAAPTGLGSLPALGVTLADRSKSITQNSDAGRCARTKPKGVMTQPQRQFSQVSFALT
jgi:hypothetical protein